MNDELFACSRSTPIVAEALEEYLSRVLEALKQEEQE
jgi:hypothetical protein